MSARKLSKINLLPQKGLATSAAGRILLWILSTFRIIVIVTEIIVMIAFLSRFWFDAQNTDLTDEIKQKQAVIAASIDFENKFKQTQNQLEILANLTKDNQLMTSAAKEIGGSLPSDIFLSTLSLSKTNINFEGSSPNEKSIQQLIVNLQDSDLFSDVNLGEISSSNEESLLFNFKISLSFKGKEAKKAK